MIYSSLKTKELTFVEVMNLVCDAGLTKSGFSHERFYYAFIYEKIFWSLANMFSGCRCEITHIEYALYRIDRSELFICLDLFRERHIHEFGRFLSETPNLLPVELRNMFDVCVGFNYGSDGGFIVKKDEIMLLTQDEYDEIESEGILSEEIVNLETYRALSRLTNLLFARFGISKHYNIE